MKLLYRFSGPITNKVIHSQVAGNLRALREAGLDGDFLCWCGAAHALRHRAAYARAEADLTRILGRPARWRLTADRLPVLDRWLKRRELAAATRALGAEPVAIQTRSLDLAPLLPERRAGEGPRLFVQEVRGDRAAELEFLAGDDRRGLAARLAALEGRLESSFAAADLVLCVSQALAERLVSRHGLSRERLIVQPCTADETRFRPDPAARAERRRELGLPPHAHLLIYSGSLVKGWDQPQAVRAFAIEQLGSNPDLHLLLLSPDATQARELISALPTGRAHHRSLSHLEIQGWLCAGDSALLLRAAHPLNEVASPTKAAECLLCGLPLLLSPGIGDYSGWVEKEGAGRIVPAGGMRLEDWRALGDLQAEAVRHAALPRVARGPHAAQLAARLEALVSGADSSSASRRAMPGRAQSSPTTTQ